MLQGLKPTHLFAFIGTTEVVPCYKATCAENPLPIFYLASSQLSAHHRVCLIKRLADSRSIPNAELSAHQSQ
jgi:hypothetical protein